MTITIVNGYTCETGCEVAKARTGQDPHPTRHDTTEGKGGTDASSASPLDRPAVIFGGTLSQILSTTAIAPTGSASNAGDVAARAPANAIDLRV